MKLMRGENGRRFSLSRALACTFTLTPMNLVPLTRAQGTSHPHQHEQPSPPRYQRLQLLLPLPGSIWSSSRRAFEVVPITTVCAHVSKRTCAIAESRLQRHFPLLLSRNSYSGILCPFPSDDESVC
ncbi:hypothetical protein BDU57DRAFT_105794 [Ampelomyces quisqualis]|uniref:Uncharacterized protein n=1 Tax=Ampelomyces quisqualis TaxID=50730 RepID=A0A6A5Q9L6_AMPQU|nr:hypothetical protein BDU57DRAFT_105794 [Ampelomyces quisqualis]